MKQNALKARLETGLVYFDGGTGSVLSSLGLPAGARPEKWTVQYPERIRALHTAYFSAGADIVKTNTFGVNPIHYRDEAEFETLVRDAVRLAREARDEAKRDGFVALDLGPLGLLFEPYGPLSFEDAVSAFSKTVRVGRDAGADLVLIETMTDSYETKAAVLAAKASSDLPVFVTNSYDARGRMMMGANAEAMVALLEGLGVDALGVNCSTGPVEMLETVRSLCKYASVPVIVNPNAGLPHIDDEGRTVYDLTPEEFAKATAELVSVGARVVGGCCGTTPDYIRALVRETEKTDPVPLSKKPRSVISSYTHALELSERPVRLGRRISPIFEPSLRDALLSGDYDELVTLAEEEEEDDAQVLLLHLAFDGVDEKETLPEAVRELQGMIGLPLSFETEDLGAMERAMRCYNGKALLISASDGETLGAVLSLAKKYGGAVAIRLSNGDERPDRVREILARAKEYGLSENDLLAELPTEEGATQDPVSDVRLRRFSDEVNA